MVVAGGRMGENLVEEVFRASPLQARDEMQDFLQDS